MDFISRLIYRKRRLADAVRPVVEGLEQRQLLSVTLDQDTGILSITGTDESDVIVVRPAANRDNIRVQVNGEKAFFAKADVKGITVDAGAGNDYVSIFQVGGRIEIPATISGGAGDDTLAGGDADDVIIGGAGHDQLHGGRGNDLLRGGDGNDTIIGGAGDDTVIGGLGIDHIVTGNGNDDVRGGNRDVIGRGASPSFPVATYTGDPSGYFPNHIRYAYGLGDLSDENYTNRGQGQAIAIIIAYRTVTATRDLATFSKEFNLPLPSKKNFQVVKAYRGKSFVDDGWAGEALMDIQWAHAIAPAAKIYLVEAKTNMWPDMLHAVDVAVGLLNRRHGGGVVSMSWGQDIDQPWMEIFEGTFSSPAVKNISFIAAAGDAAVQGYPSTSPYVTSVGGTALYLDIYGSRIPSTAAGGGGGAPAPAPAPAPGAGASEEPWVAGGGGPSTVFAAPWYQRNRGNRATGLPILYLAPDYRGTPDLAMIGDPATGVPVYNSQGDMGGAGWFTIGGTSLGTPMFAGVVALANQLRRTSAPKKSFLGNTLNQRIYRLAESGPDRYFNDIQTGGTANYPALPGWDYATGWGSPRCHTLIPALAEQKFVFTSTKLQVSGTRSIYISGQQGQTGQGQQGQQGQQQVGLSGPQWVAFKGISRLQGFNTLNLDAIHFTNIFGAPQDTTYTIDIYGMDPTTGTATPATVDPVSGKVTAPGTPLYLYRIGNTLTGIGYYTINTTTTQTVQQGQPGQQTGQQPGQQPGQPGQQPGEPQTIVTNTTSTGAVKFVGTISKGGSVEGEFYAINPDGSKIKNVLQNKDMSLIRGKFKS